MAKDSRFHASNQDYNKYSDASLKKAIETGQITKDDAALLTRFINEIEAKQHITPARRFKLFYTLIGWRTYIGPFRQNTIDDLYAGIRRIMNATKPNGENLYKQNTLADFIRFLKRFYHWLIKNKLAAEGLTSDIIDEIKNPRYDSMTKKAGDILEPDEVKAMIDACKNSKDRALIAMLYEGAFRIGELGNMRWDQIKLPDNDGWKITVNVNDKTGKPRYIPLVSSKQYIIDWRNNYPKEAGTPEGDAYVFVTNKQKIQLQYRGTAKRISEIAERAGVNKRITPHIFRHSRITHMIREGFGSEIIKKIGWGNVTTNMFSTYSHLTSEDIDNEVARKYGIVDIKEAKKQNSLNPIQCENCGMINAPTIAYCGKCGKPLTETEITDQETIMNLIDNDPELIVVMKKIIAMKEGKVGK